MVGLKPGAVPDADSPPRPALFLDRDGVINVEKNYVHRIEDFVFVDGIFELCEAAKRAGLAIVVVTNQAGIGRGYYSERAFLDLTDWMCGNFSARGIDLDGVYYCPYHPEHGIGQYRAESFERKPNPGMILRAQAELAIDLGSSVLIGDKVSDLLAARRAGVGQSLLLTDEPIRFHAELGPITCVRSLHEARSFIRQVVEI